MLIAIFALVLAYPIARDVLAQDVDKSILTYDDMVNKLEQLKKGLLLKRNITMTLVFLIGLLGLVTTAIQKLKWKWTGQVTIVNGLVIGILTLLLNTFFPLDHRGYQKAAHQADVTVANVERLLLEFNYANENEKDDFRKRIAETINVFYQNYESMWSHLIEPVQLIPAAYAENSVTSAPSWTLKRRFDDKKFYYFVGIDSSSSITSAKKASYDDAIYNAFDTWRIQIDDVQKDVDAVINSQDLS